MYVDLKKVSDGALINIRNQIECVIILSQVDGDVSFEKYLKFLDDLDEVKKEIEFRNLLK